MKVSIIEKRYAEQGKMYLKNMITESTVNRRLESLEANGYKVKSVQLVHYEDEELERVVITYD